MSTPELTQSQLRTRGYAALLREFGPIDFIRFMQEFDPGKDDYTRDRRKWIDRLTVEQIHQMIQDQRHYEI